MFSNFSTSDPGLRAEKIADIYLGDELGPREAESEEPEAIVRYNVDAEELARFAGSYYSVELDTTYRLAVNDGVLRADHFRNESVSLSPVAPDAFEGDAWWFGNIVFTRDDRGVVTGLEVNSDRVRKLHFIRVEGSRH